MTNKFCFKCGKNARLKHGLCSNCFKEEIKLPKKIEVVLCSKCRLMKFENRWIDYNPEKLLSKFIKRKKAKITEKNNKLTVVISGKCYETRLHKNKIICTACIKKSSGYYEGVIQLRGFTDDDLKNIEDIVNEINKKSFYVLKNLKHGIDIKVGNKSIINSITKKIRKRIPCEQKSSSQIATRIDGRNVYRIFILLRKK